MSTGEPPPDISVVLPLPGAPSDLSQAIRTAVTLEDSSFQWELLLVDQRPRDDLHQHFRGDKRIRLLKSPPDRAFQQGIALSRGRGVLSTSSELSFGTGVLIEMAEALNRDAEMVLVSPYVPGGSESNAPFLRSRIRRWGNQLLGPKARQFLPFFSDCTIGYRGHLVRRMDLAAPDTEIHRRILVESLRLGYRLREIPGHKKWNPSPVKMTHNSAQPAGIPS